MKLNCPYCGETFSYEISLAGRSVACSYCENVIKMPLVEELPAEAREELQREESKKQEKQKRTYQRKQDRFLKEIEKEEKLKLQQEERTKEQQKKEEQERKIESAQKPVAEELAVKKRYRALRMVARWNKAVAGLVLLGYLASVAMGALTAARGVVPWSWVAASALLLAVPAICMTLTVWASGELILVLLDMADDARITRLLMKRQAYRTSQR
ncbi:MAG: hypothetical protein HQ582_18635 [Planctomycetes bacterium]|nr:hypothetical protein [Planctomycetota bacterium]